MLKLSSGNSFNSFTSFVGGGRSKERVGLDGKFVKEGVNVEIGKGFGVNDALEVIGVWKISVGDNSGCGV